MQGDLAADGFCIVQNAVERGALSALEAELSRLFETFDDLPAGVPKRLSRVGQGVLEINLLFALLPALLRGPVVSRIGELCAEALGREVRMIYANAILKPAHGGAEVLAHQDTAYDSSSVQGPGRYTAWLPFRDVSAESGTLYYLSGSHRGGSVAHLEQDGVRFLAAPPPARYPSEAVEIAVGGFALHSSAIVHGSYPNTSNRARLALSLRLLAS